MAIPQGGNSPYTWSATYDLSVGICEMTILGSRSAYTWSAT